MPCIVNILQSQMMSVSDAPNFGFMFTVLIDDTGQGKGTFIGQAAFMMMVIIYLWYRPLARKAGTANLCTLSIGKPLWVFCYLLKILFCIFFLVSKYPSAL